MSKSDRERCHGCGCLVDIAPSSDPHRRVLCARCAAEYPDDVEDTPPAEPFFDGLERDPGKRPLPTKLAPLPRPNDDGKPRTNMDESDAWPKPKT